MPGIPLCINWFKKHYYLLPLLFFFNPCLAQKSKVDELQTKLKQPVTDSVRLKLLKELSAAYSSVDPQKKFYYANVFKALAEKLHNQAAAADAYIYMGTSYFIRSRYDSALYYFNIGYDKSEKAKYLLGMGKSLVNLGFTYDRLDVPRESIKNYTQALDIFKKIKLQRGIDQCNTNIGSLYYDRAQYQTAESYFKQCYESYVNNKDTAGIAASLYSMGNCAQALKRDQEALKYFNRSLALRTQLGDSSGVALVHRGIGIVYMHLKQYNRSIQHLNIALKSLQVLQEKYEEAAVLKILTEVYTDIKQYDKAAEYATSALKIAYTIKSKTAASIALRDLTDIYRRKHDMVKAFDYQTRYVATEDSILTERDLKEITLAEFGRMRSENATLSKDNRDIASRNIAYQGKIEHYSNVIVITSIVLGFVILVLLTLYRVNLNKQATNKLLLQQKEEIADINQELETLNEELTTQMEITHAQNTELERLNNIKNKFFSIVSHDIRGPINSLRSLFSVYREGHIKEDELRMLLNRLEETILSTGAFLDNLLEWSKSQLEGIVLHPVDFKLKGCIDENINLLKNQIVQKKLKVTNLVPDDIGIHADQNMIKLVIRNLLSNSTKFCRPDDEITFNAHVKDGRVQISVHDSGPGISEADREKLFTLEHVISTGTQGEKGNHLGLILCREMILQNQGHIWLEGGTDEGTTFWVELLAATA